MSECEKKSMLSIFLFLATIILPFLALAQIPTSIYQPSATALVVDYELTGTTEKLKPGDSGILKIVIKNNGGAPAKDILIDLEGNNFIKVENGRMRLGTMNPEDTYAVSFVVSVMSFAKAETYSLNLHTEYTGYFLSYEAPSTLGPSWKNWDKITYKNNWAIPVRVYAKTPALTVDKEIPEYVEPGKAFSIKMTLKNTGEAKVKDINVQIKLEGTEFSSTGPDNIFIKELDVYQSKNISFNLISNDKAELGLQSVPVILNFTNEDDLTMNQIEMVGLQIRGKAELNIASITTDPSKVIEGEHCNLIVRLENVGKDDAKSVYAEVDLPFQGTRKAFLGKIEPDEDAPAVFTFTPSERGTIPYTLIVKYSDDFGEHILSEPLNLTVYKDEGAVSLILAGLVILLLIIGILLWRRKK
ncbi:MAG: COG1361 S-layer family protein [Candidatus Hydrothermarchaeota archaeon]